MWNKQCTGQLDSASSTTAKRDSIDVQMNPTLYVLCQKAVLGPALWISGLCSFPPLLPESPVSLDAPGLILTKEYEAPVSNNYFLSFHVEFPSVEQRLNDTLIGSKFDVPCYGEEGKKVSDFSTERQFDLGRPVKLHVKVLRLPSETVAWEADISSICRAGHDLKAKKLQVLALTHFTQGKYRIYVTNIEARPDLAAFRTSITIHSGQK